MVARGQSKERGEQSRHCSRSNSRGENYKAKCWYYNKTRHLKKEYWKRKEDGENPKKEACQVKSGMIDEVLFAKLGMIYETLSNCNVS